jgi:alkylation response protein AidB-like acyl-CoA dehydrogenase
MRLDATQRMVSSTARGLLESAVSVEVLRECTRSDRGFDARLWASITELGWLDMASLGAGGGRSQLPLAGLICEEIGRVAAPLPFLSTTVGLACLSSAARDCEPVPVPGPDTGPCVLAFAGIDAPLRFRPSASGSGGAVSTDAPVLVEWGDSATRIIAVCHQHRSAAGPGAAIVAVDPSAPGVRITPVRCLDNERAAWVAIAGATASAPVQAIDESTLAELRSMLDLLRASQLVGGARRTLEITVRYALDRKQFNRAIGTFQAVQHLLANVAIRVEGAEMAVREALQHMSLGLPTGRVAATATVIAAQAAEYAATECAQVHGGVGVTQEYVLQYYFRRAKAGLLRFGEAAARRERIARVLVDEREFRFDFAVART